MRLRLLGSLISATHFPHLRILTPLYCFFFCDWWQLLETSIGLGLALVFWAIGLICAREKEFRYLYCEREEVESRTLAKVDLIHSTKGTVRRRNNIELKKLKGLNCKSTMEENSLPTNRPIVGFNHFINERWCWSRWTLFRLSFLQMNPVHHRRHMSVACTVRSLNISKLCVTIFIF